MKFPKHPNFVGIEQTPGIYGGSARIAGTRIPVWTLVSYREAGRTDAEILAAFPQLNEQRLSLAWEFYVAHRSKIDLEIAAQENA